MLITSFQPFLSLVPSCGVTTAVEYSWSTYSSVDLPEAFLQSSLMPIVPYSMEPHKSYTYSVMANYVGSTSYQFNITLSTALDSVSANAGASIAIGNLNTLTLAATIVDNAYENLDPSMFTCEWTCTLLNGDICRESSDHSKMLQLSAITDCSADITGRLSPNNYVFSVVVKNNATGSTSPNDSPSSYWKVSEGLIPVAVVDSNNLKPGINDTSFEMSAFIDPATLDKDAASYSFKWDTQAECAQSTFPTLDMTSFGDGYALATDPNGDFLKFNPGYLLPSTTYCFQVDVETFDDSGAPLASGYSQMLIKTRDIPSG